VARIGIDTVCLFGMVQWFLPTTKSILLKKILPMGAALLALALATILVSVGMKVMFLLVTLIAFAVGSWFLILNHKERTFIGNQFKPIHSYK